MDIQAPWEHEHDKRDEQDAKKIIRGIFDLVNKTKQLINDGIYDEKLGHKQEKFTFKYDTQNQIIHGKYVYKTKQNMQTRNFVWEKYIGAAMNRFGNCKNRVSIINDRVYINIVIKYHQKIDEDQNLLKSICIGFKAAKGITLEIIKSKNGIIDLDGFKLADDGAAYKVWNYDKSELLVKQVIGTDSIDAYYKYKLKNHSERLDKWLLRNLEHECTFDQYTLDINILGDFVNIIYKGRASPS